MPGRSRFDSSIRRRRRRSSSVSAMSVARFRAVLDCRCPLPEVALERRQETTPMAETRAVDSKYVSLDRRTLSIAIVAAYGVGLWTHFVHWRSGAREAHDVTFWAHWMRDSTLSVPLVVLAVLAATMVIGRHARAL